MRRDITLLCIAVFALVAATAMADGYVIILKNGDKIRARRAFDVRGDKALITLTRGTLVSYPLNRIDMVETERYNQLGFGDAFLIEELSVEAGPVRTPTPKLSLGDYASIHVGGGEIGSSRDPTPTPTPGISLRPVPYRDRRVVRAFAEVFQDHSLYVFKTSVGSRPEYLFIQAITDQETEVFTTLRTVAEAFSVVHKLHPTIAPAAVELEMVSTAGTPAGTFRLTPAMARSLARGELPIEQFYIDFVIF
jgi:hypothetical protein